MPAAPYGLVQKQLLILGHAHPHPLPALQAGGPLPSDGRGKIVLRRSAHPASLEAARDRGWLFPLPSDGRRSGGGKFCSEYASGWALVFAQTLGSSTRPPRAA